MIEREKIEPTPERKETGKNVRLKISVFRHTEKTLEGMLHELGKIHAKEIGKEKEIPPSGVKIYVSPFQRTIETTKKIVEGIEEQHKEHRVFKTRTREELAPPMWRNFEKVITKFKSIEKERGHDELVRYLLSAPEVMENLKDWTNALAYLVDRYINMAHRLYNNSDVELTHVTHDPLLSSFLKSVIILRNEQGKEMAVENIDQIGGPFQPGENFDINVHLDNQGQKHLSVELRGKTYEINREKLREMAEKNKMRAYKGRVIKQEG